MERRLGPRLPSGELHLALTPGQRRLPVLNVGCRGLGVRHEGWPFPVGEHLRVHLYLADKLMIKNLRVRVVRIDEQALGCVYENLGLIEAGKLFRLATLLRSRSGTPPQELSRKEDSSSENVSFLRED
jgi:hypothetical protein